jgi:hypothetical protein
VKRFLLHSKKKTTEKPSTDTISAIVITTPRNKLTTNRNTNSKINGLLSN